MCGIAVCVSPDPVLRNSFQTGSLGLLGHRGPDDRGIWEDNTVTLIHTRLSILDLSAAGHQPMESGEGRFVITYNGEIYNHVELRKRFLKEVQFKSNSDTETILALYERLGCEMTRYLIGMWSLAIWDTVERTLFVSRDRYGQKPLYWTRPDEHTWLFSSEIKPLLPYIKKITPNHTASVEYLSLGNYGHLREHTFINEIKSFPPAHQAVLKPTATALEVTPYWKIPVVDYHEKKDFTADQRELLKELIRNAVLLQTLSDVPLGMTLSGGIDSSVIAGILANHSPVPIEVFSARNKGNQYDESPYAQKVIDHWNGTGKLRSNLIDMDALSIREHLEEGILIQEEPFGDPSILSHLQIMKAVKQKGIKVILGGQGADEIFFGYDNMFYSLAGSLLKNGQLKSFARLIKQLELSKADIARIVMGVTAPGLFVRSRRAARARRRFFIQPELIRQVDNQMIHLARPDDFYDTWTESISGVHLPHLVHYDDRNGMALGIEGRMPFLDHNLLEFLSSIKTEYFAWQGVRKALLKESCAEYLPEGIKARQDKVGFFAPIHEMIHRDIEYVFDQFQSVVFPQKIVDQKILQDDLEFYRGGKIDVIRARRIWRVLSYATWLKCFKINF